MDSTTTTTVNSSVAPPGAPPTLSAVPSAAPRLEAPVDSAPKAPRARRARRSDAVPAPAAAPAPRRAPIKRADWQGVELTPRILGLYAAFVVSYLVLVAWGIRLGGADGTTAWYPAAGLALAAITIGGPRWIGATLLAGVLSIPLSGDSSSLFLSLVITGLITAVFGVAGLTLGKVLDRDRPLARVSDAWWMIGIGTVATPLIAAIGSVGSLWLAGTPAPAGGYTGMIRVWVLGDALGIAALAPAIIVAYATLRRSGAKGFRPQSDQLGPQSLIAILALILLTPAVYYGGGEDLRAVAALPLCWLALRFGVAGAVIGGATWTISSALLLGVAASAEEFNGLQAFLLTGTTLAVMVGAVVSERERTQGDLRHLAMHDQPSGLPNEPHLVELTDAALAEARGREVTLLIVKFAGLRQVSAALSKQDTERLVTSLTAKLTSIAGRGAVIARPGFDRFAMLITGADQARRQQIAEELVETLHQPLAVESREVFVDPRIGITVGLPGEAGDVVLAHAVHAADVAAVADGNRVGYYDASIERAHRDRQELTEDLRVAVERGELLLAFQPIVTAKEGRVVAAEALLRWVDKKRGPVSPMDFIPVAEETGLILPIGRWVLNEACQRATQWPHVGGNAIDVSVNVSPIQLMDEGFVDDVAEALERSGLPANRLRVEITEGIVLEDIERTILRIQQLRDMGVETMLDDFGTGHSSLAWVQRLPVSCIKIDRAFVGDIAVDGIDRAIVHASLYLSRALGTETVAEGVETEAQREQLVRMGCQKLQGFLFARPQPADVFPDWLAKQRARAVGAGVVTQQAPPIGIPAPAPAPSAVPAYAAPQAADVHASAYGAPAVAAPAARAPQAFAPSTASGMRQAPMPNAGPRTFNGGAAGVRAAPMPPSARPAAPAAPVAPVAEAPVQVTPEHIAPPHGLAAVPAPRQVA